MDFISEKTKVNLFTVIAIIPTVTFVVFFIASVSYKSDANALRIEKLETRQDAQTILLLDIRDRLIRLESKKGN